jgi:ABC-type dipeptide/oligopeptide/nickel transport system permease subunit
MSGRLHDAGVILEISRGLHRRRGKSFHMRLMDIIMAIPQLLLAVRLSSRRWETVCSKTALACSVCGPAERDAALAGHVMTIRDRKL